MSDTSHFGPLAQLAGEWEGAAGIDVSYHHDDNQAGETPYREHITFKPFGPVANGAQSLYGLDYKMAAWRIGEEDPFHTEIGYWLWDGDLGHVMKGFVIPRGSTILAGGESAVDATSFTMRADVDTDEYGVCSNTYLFNNARCTSYVINVSVDGDTLTYDQDSVLTMNEYDEPYHHTDANTLQRVTRFEIPPPA